MLRNLHDVGLTPQQIASRMGDGLSRAEVVNKLWEIGIRISTAPISEPPREKFKTPKTPPVSVSLAPIPRSTILMD
jgi:hypothetical protein